MIKIEEAEVVGWEHAIRGMRNPMNSWEKSDSTFGDKAPFFYVNESGHWVPICHFKFDEELVGPNDKDLMMRLAKNGPVHAKYRRMITVYVDITAPLYWWKEFDTYKVGTVANSCSTMHKIHDKEFELEDFSYEHLSSEFGIFDTNGDDCEVWSFNGLGMLRDCIIPMLNHYRKLYIKTKTKPMKEEQKRHELLKKYWWQLIQLLPSSYNQKRTIMLNYEVLSNIYKSRKNHKLDEWRELCEWIERLPHSEIITVE